MLLARGNFEVEGECGLARDPHIPTSLLMYLICMISAVLLLRLNVKRRKCLSFLSIVDLEYFGSYPSCFVGKYIPVLRRHVTPPLN